MPWRRLDIAKKDQYPEAMSKFRWGILGTGLAAQKFAFGLRSSKASSAVAIASRSYENAERFGSLLHVGNVHRHYQDAINDASVDGVYIATPPSTHRELALLCLQSGKPVLVEKPFALNVDEALEVVQMARSRGVFCMEGMWTRFMPLVRRVKQMVESGQLGEIRLVTGSFGIAEAVDPANPLFNPGLGGGSLLDRAVYPISLVQHLLGIPTAVTAEAGFGRTGVDEQTAMVFRYDSGALAVLHSSLITQASNELTVMGSRAVLRIHAPIYRPFRMTLTKICERRGSSGRWSRLAFLKESHWTHQALQRVGSRLIPLMQRNTQTITEPYGGNGYHHEADELVRCIAEGRLESDIMPLDDSLAVMELLDTVRSRWSGTSCRIAASE